MEDIDSGSDWNPCSLASNVITCVHPGNVYTQTNKQPSPIIFSVNVSPSVTDTLSVTNQAVLSYFSNTVTSTVVTPVNPPDIQITKTSSASSAEDGQTVRFTVTASNIGKFNIVSAVIKDQLPTGFTSITSNSSSYDTTTGLWNITDLAPGASQSFVITGTVDVFCFYKRSEYRLSPILQPCGWK